MLCLLKSQEQRCTLEEKAGTTSYENMSYCCFHTSLSLMQHHSISQWTTPHENFHSCMLAGVKQESHGREVTLNQFLTPSITQLKPCAHRNILGHREKRYWYETPRHRLQKFNTKCLVSAQIHYSHLTITTQTTSKGSLTKQQVHTRSVCLLSRVSHQDNNSIFFLATFSSPILLHRSYIQLLKIRKSPNVLCLICIFKYANYCKTGNFRVTYFCRKIKCAKMFIATITGSMVFRQKAVNHQNNCLPINYCSTLPEIFSFCKKYFSSKCLPLPDQFH